MVVAFFSCVEKRISRSGGGLRERPRRLVLGLISFFSWFLFCFCSVLSVSSVCLAHAPVVTAVTVFLSVSVRVYKHPEAPRTGTSTIDASPFSLNIME
jgi:hypothetical protein